MAISFLLPSERKDVTLAELAAMLEQEHRVRFAPARCIASLSGAGSRSKKTAHASEQERPDVARRRQAWFDGQPELDPERLIFIDESGASTMMRGCAAAPNAENTAVPPCRTASGNDDLRGRTAPARAL